MTVATYLSLVRRESRGARGRLAFFTACLAVGVAAVVAVAGLSESLDGTIRSEARQLLAADVSIEGSRPVPASIEPVLASVAGLERASVREMATVVAAPGPNGVSRTSALVELKTVQGGYPFYGTLRLDPVRPLAELLDPEGVVAAPELLSRLGIAPGDVLRVGSAEFRVRGTVLGEPDRIAMSLALAPRVFISAAGLERAGLEQLGSRVEHKLLLKLPDGASKAAIDSLAERVKAALPQGGWFEVETFSEAQPALRSGLRRAERFLGLVALLSLLVGGIGVAQTVRAWIAGRLDAIAILRCLGVRPREVTALYLGQTLGLALAGSLVGAAAGTAAMFIAPVVLGGLLPPGVVHAWQPWAVGRGLALGVAVALLFSVPALAAVRRVPPARVMRRDAEPLATGRAAGLASSALLVAGIFVTAWIQSRSAGLGAGFSAGILAAAGLLALGAWAVVRAVGAFPRRFAGVTLRHGLAALARPGAGTLGAIVALGLGVLVVLGMWIVQSRLSEQLRADLPKDAPTAFFIDIQPGQLPGVVAILEAKGATRFDSVPVVTARLASVDGRPAEELARGAPDEGRARWVFTREQRLTYMEKLPPDNRVVEGALWSDPSRPEISIEKDFARDLGVSVGSKLTLDVQGVPVELEVTSLRTVDWRTFGINFFLVVEPGVLDGAPQQRVAVARLPAAREQEAQDALAAAFPNVTMLRIREILERVVAILDRVGLAVRILGGFTVLAGIAILAGAVGAASSRRGREVALLKTIGMTRRGVAAVFSVEYALIGLVAGVIGATGATVLARMVLVRGMEIPFAFEPVPYAIAVAGAVVLTVAAGIAASARALSRRPIEVLRSAE